MEQNLDPKATPVEPSTEKTYTQAEVDELLQKEGDRRVTEALKTYQKRAEQKTREAEKLARMNEAEKYQYELEQREKAIQEKEQQLILAENKAQAAKILAEKGLAANLVDFVVAEDADVMNANIKALEGAFKSSVKGEVEKRLGAKTPEKGADNDISNLTRESFRKMSLAEQSKIATENPELYAAMTSREY